MSARAFASLVLVASLAVSCSRVEAPVSPAQASAQNQSAGTVLAQEPLLDRIHSAPTTIAHGGTRRLEYHYEVAGAPQSLTYEERVTADGRGHFALDPVRVAAPALTEAQREVFDIVQKNREGFFFRFRDFGVRARDLCLENYRFVDLKTNPIIAGRTCQEFEVERLVAPQVKYRIAVDVATALVLRCVETAPGGREIARFEFIDFTLAPAITDETAWFTPNQSIVQLDASNLAATGLHFQPVEPRLLPVGYQLMQSEIVRYGQDAWIRRIYGDGVENIFLLQNGSHGAEGELTSEANRPTRGPTTHESSIAPPPPPGPYKIRVFSAGPWTLAEIARGEEQIFAVGKNEADVLLLLKSSL